MLIPCRASCVFSGFRDGFQRVPVSSCFFGSFVTQAFRPHGTTTFSHFGGGFRMGSERVPTSSTPKHVWGQLCASTVSLHETITFSQFGRVPNGFRQVPRLTDLESMQQIVRTISFNAFVSIALLQNMFEPTLGMYNLTNWG